MKTIITSVLFWVLFSVGGSATAALITVNDGDEFTYNPSNEYFFNAELSEENQMVTFGVNLAQGYSFDFIVSAPVEFDLFALLSTGPNFGGVAIINPAGVARVFAGTSFTFPVDGDFFIGQTQWLSIAFTDLNLAADYLATLPGGVLPIGGVLSSPENNFTFFGGASSGDGNNGNSGNSGNNGNGDTGVNPTPVPEPGTLALLGAGLLLLGSVSLKRK